MNKKIILVAVIAISLLLIIVVYLRDRGAENSDSDAQAELGISLDVVSPFYNDWLDAAKSTSTDPYQAGLATDSRLSESVKSYIATAQADTESTLDPVLCQSSVPPRIGAKLSYELDGKAQYLLLARGVGVTPEKAVVSLEVVDGAWLITDIECVSGEEGPVREFSFEREGFLLKSPQAPLDPNLWYLVFEENGQNGHTAPLYFDAASMCVANDETESVCEPTQFINPSQALVKGEMTESGVEVKRVEFIQ